MFSNQETESLELQTGLQSRIQDIFSRHKSSVVKVKATKEVQVGEKSKRLLKIGSGFFVSKDAHVLTTGLLDDPERIWIEYENAFYLAEEIGKDDLCNLSLLKLTKTPKNFNFISLGDSTSDLQIGSFVVSLTCALEFNVGPTFGLFQSREFSFGKRFFPTKMLRCGLALGPGEVGSPVFDLNGRFVGICHAALPDLQSSFVLPASACLRVRDDLLFSGKVDYGWFGITANRKLNDTDGFQIVVQKLLQNSPASKSKLKEGDIILKIQDRVVREQGDLAYTAFFARPGNIVEFLVRRDDKEIKIPLRVEKRPMIPKLVVETNLNSDHNSTFSELNASKAN